MKLYDFDFIECYDEEANYDFDENQKKQIEDLGDISFSQSLASSDVFYLQTSQLHSNMPAFPIH